MNYFGESFKQYIKHFKVLFIIMAVCGMVLLFFSLKPAKANGYYDSPNTERVYGDRRVFDYGDQLTTAEEEKLNSYILEAEKKICADIVIVTLNESLKDYAPEYRANYNMTITPDKYVMVYADKFYEDNKFGYDRPQVLNGKSTSGDGVLLLDNVYREEETGKIYTWMCTTGKCEREYSSSEIDSALDVFYDYVDSDYYKACERFVDKVVRDMSHESVAADIPPYAPFLVGGIIFLIYFFANIREKAGKDTTKADTYLDGNQLRFIERDDIFLRKSVTKHYNPPQSSSSGGGGGHHVSGGGGSHGGGGHSR